MIGRVNWSSSRQSCRRVCSSKFKIPERDSIPGQQIESSTRSSPPSPMVSEWDYRLAVRLLKLTAAVYGLLLVHPTERFFNSPCKGQRVNMTELHHVVFIVDDDASVRDALNSLIRSVGLRVELFGLAREFLQRGRPDVPSCLVLDVRLPGIGGLDLQRQLADANVQTPIIFITAHGDIPMSVRAMKAGAVEFLTKPFRDQDLLDAIQIALERDRARLQREAEIAVLRERFESLTLREREVVAMVVSGMPNKQIAGEIGITENTVKVHRSRAMEKMQAQSLADLVKMVERLKTEDTLASP